MIMMTHAGVGTDISIHEGDSVGLERAGANFEKGSSDQSKWPALLAFFLIRLFQKQTRYKLD